MSDICGKCCQRMYACEDCEVKPLQEVVEAARELSSRLIIDSQDGTPYATPIKDAADRLRDALAKVEGGR